MRQFSSKAFLVLSCLLQSNNASPVVEKRQAVSSFIADNYDFVGCYGEDAFSVPPLDRSVVEEAAKMDHDKCATACAAYRFFGIYRGNACFCGDEISPSSPDLPGQCNMECSGLGANTPAGTCGGSGIPIIASIFIKKTPDEPFELPPDVTTSYSIGCYLTNSGISAYSVTVITVAHCQVVCRGYKFYGVQASGNICACYDQINFIQLNPPECNALCAGRACGGGGTIRSIYTAQSACENNDQQLIVKNPSFESGMAYWAITQSSGPITWTARADITAVQGSRLARIDSKAVGDYIVIAQVVSLCPGIQYQVSYSAKHAAGGGCRTWIAVERGSRLDRHDEVTDWTLHVDRFFPPAASTELSLIMECVGIGSGGFRKLYIDDIKLSRVVDLVG